MVVVWQGLLKKGGYFDVVVGGLARDFAGGCVAGSGRDMVGVARGINWFSSDNGRVACSWRETERFIVF